MDDITESLKIIDNTASNINGNSTFHSSSFIYKMANEDVSIYKEDKKRGEIVDNAEGYISEEEAIIKLKTLGTQKLGLSSEIKDYEFKIVGKAEIEQDMCYEIEAEYKTDETNKEVGKFAVSKDENKIYKMDNDKYIQIEI